MELSLTVKVLVLGLLAIASFIMALGAFYSAGNIRELLTHGANISKRFGYIMVKGIVLLAIGIFLTLVAGFLIYAQYLNNITITGV